MTKYSKYKKLNDIHIKIVGHSGNSDVCRAVSTLVNILAQKLIWLNEDKKIDLKICTVKSGNSEFIFEVIAMDIIDLVSIDAIIDTIETGFRLLENSYSDNTCLEVDC